LKQIKQKKCKESEYHVGKLLAPKFTV